MKRGRKARSVEAAGSGQFEPDALLYGKNPREVEFARLLFSIPHWDPKTKSARSFEAQLRAERPGLMVAKLNHLVTKETSATKADGAAVRFFRTLANVIEGGLHRKLADPGRTAFLLWANSATQKGENLNLSHYAKKHLLDRKTVGKYAAELGLPRGRPGRPKAEK